MPRFIAITLLVLLAALPTACSRDTESTVTSDTPAIETTAMDTSATTTGSTGGSVSSMSAPDKDFVMKAAQGSLAEVSMGQMAGQKASSAGVKSFAQRMVADHSAVTGELTKLMTEKGLAMPAQPEAGQRSAADHLSSLSGAEFDTAYMKHMVEDHENDVKAFDEASRTSTDSDVKAWAAGKLPVLQDHLKTAKDIQRSLK